MDRLLATFHTRAYEGRWDEALALLRSRPEWTNVGTISNGYTALHQAAWHGANLEVVGEILALGADRTLRTKNRQQSAAQIAAEKHPDRSDLAFLLSEKPRATAQLLRKVLAEEPDLFRSYDLNRMVFDSVLDALGYDLFGISQDRIGERLVAAIHGILGVRPSPGFDMPLETEIALGNGFQPELWADRISGRLAQLCKSATSIPIERSWAVVGDLFSPFPSVWTGARGDPFLWMEMQQALNRIPIPENLRLLSSLLSAALQVHVGEEMSGDETIFIARFDRGGMSSGGVSPPAWREVLLPCLLQRAEWIMQSWRGQSKPALLR